MNETELEKTDTEKRAEELERLRSDFNSKTVEELVNTPKYYGDKFSKILFDRISAESNIKLAEYLENDKLSKKPDTTDKLLKILDLYEQYVRYLDKAPLLNIEIIFDSVYNLSKEVFRICKIFQTSLYAELSTPYIISVACLLRKCKILQRPKYIEWAIKIYIDAVKSFEREDQNDKALSFIEEIYAEFQQSRIFVKENYEASVEECYKLYDMQLLSLVYNYKLRSGKEVFNQWKDKIANEIKPKKYLLLALMETLKEERKEPVQIFDNKKSTEFLKKNEWRVYLAKHVYELVKDDFDKLIECLQTREAGKPDITSEADKVAPNSKAKPIKAKEPQTKSEEGKIYNSLLSKLSDTFSFSMQADLMIYCYTLGLFNEFQNLSKTAVKRSWLYRFERPFIVDLKFLSSSLPNVVKPEGYEVIELNLNEPYLKEEIKRVRNVLKDRILDMRDTGDTDDDLAKYKLRDNSECSFKELKLTDHKFVYLAYKQSYEPENAIIDIEVCIADEEKGPQNKKYENYERIAIPINQYRGVKAIYSTIPFMCIKRNLTSKETKDDELLDAKSRKQASNETPITSSLNSITNPKNKNPLYSSRLLKYGYITEIQAVIDQFAYVRPSFEFTKVDVDLRQVPKEFIKVKNLDYVYINYRRENTYFLSYRIIELLKAVEELENRDLQAHNVNSPSTIIQKELNMQFDEGLFLNVVRELNRTANALTKYEGFKELIFDEFYQINYYLWDKYISNYCFQIEHYYYEKLWNDVHSERTYHFTRELTDKKMSTIVNYLRVSIKALRLCDFDCDLLFYVKIVAQAAKLLEINEKDEEASQILWEAHEKIEEYRAYLQGNYIDKRKEYLLPLCLTTDNNRLKEIFKRMEDKYSEWKLNVENLIIKQKDPQLQAQEDASVLRELDYENEKFKSLHLKHDRPTSGWLLNQLPLNSFSEFDLSLYAIQSDILCAFSRCFIKAHQKNEIPTDFKRNSTTKTGKLNIPNMTFLLTYKNTKTAKATVQNYNTLKNNLQEAKYIEPDALKYSIIEKNLLQFAGKNKYLQAIFVTTLALNRETIIEQTQCLQKALEIVEKIKSYQNQLFDHVVERAEHYICYALTDYINNIDKVLSGDQAKQFWMTEKFYQSYIDNKALQPERKNPQSPLLIKISNTSLTFKVSDYRPLIAFKVLMENPNKQNVDKVVLYGREIKGENSVGVNSTECNNTGVKFNPNSVIEVKKLTKNKVYRFCCAAYDKDQTIINKPSEPTIELITGFPLSIHALYFYIGKSAFYLRNYEVSKKALDETLAMGLKKKSKSTETFKMLSEFTLVKENCLAYSTIELQNLGEAIHMHVLCDFFLFKKKHKYDKRKTTAHTQRFLLSLVDLFLIGCEVSSFSKDHRSVIRGLLAAYNLCENFLKKNHIHKTLLSLLIRMHVLLCTVPADYYTGLVLDFANRLLVHIVQGCFINKENTLALRIMTADIDNIKKRFEYLPQVKMIQRQISKDKLGQKNKIAEKRDDNSPFEEATEFVLIEKNDQFSELFEFVLNLPPEFHNFMSFYQEKAKKQIEACEANGQAIASLNKVVELINFYLNISENVKDLGSLLTTYKDKPYLKDFLLRFIKKYGKKINEKALDDVEKMFNASEAIAKLSNIVEIKKKAIVLDIEWNPQKYGKEANSESESVVALSNEDLKNTNPHQARNSKSFINKKHSLIKGDTTIIEKDGTKAISESEKLYSEYSKALSMPYSDFHIYGKYSSKEIEELSKAGEFYYLKGTFLISQKLAELKASVNDKQEFEANMDSSNLFKLLKPDASGKETSNDQQKSKSQVSMLNLVDIDEIRSEDLDTDIYQEEQMDKRTEIVDKIIDSLCQAMLYAFVSNNYSFFFNCLITLFNFLKNIRFGVRQASTRSMRVNLNHIMESALFLIKILKLSDKVKLLNIEDKLQFNNRNLLNTNDLFIPKGGDSLFDIKGLNIRTVVNLFAYMIQMNMEYKKHNYLIYLTKLYLEIVGNYKALYVLPFTISILRNNYQKNKKLVSQINEHLKDKKEQLFELKQAAKKRNMTDEYESVQSEIKLLETKVTIEQNLGNNLKADYDKYIGIYNTLIKQTANCDKKKDIVIQLIRNYKEKKNELKVSTNTAAINQQLATMSKEIFFILQNTMVEEYKKKGDYSNTVISLHLLASFQLYNHEYQQAEENWLEALDSIFQSLHSLSECKTIFNAKASLVEDFVDKYNAYSLHLAVVILYNLSSFIFYQDLNKQRECLVFANLVIQKLLRRSLPNPSKWEDFKDYDIVDAPYKQVFTDPDVLNVSDFIHALEYFNHQNLSYKSEMNNLLLCTYMDYLASFEVFSFVFKVKAISYKIIALANIGFIAESMFYLNKLVNLRNNLDKINQAEVFSLLQQPQQPFLYFNDVSPYDERNSIAIKNFKALSIKNTEHLAELPSLYILVLVAKQVILYNIFRFENLEKLEYCALREKELTSSLQECQNLLVITKEFNAIAELQSYFTANPSPIYDKSRENLMLANFPTAITKLPKQFIEKVYSPSTSLNSLFTSLLMIHVNLNRLILCHLDSLNYYTALNDNVKSVLEFLNSRSTSTLVDQIKSKMVVEAAPKDAKAKKPKQNTSNDEIVKLLTDQKDAIDSFLQSTTSVVNFQQIFWFEAKYTAALSFYLQHRFELLDKYLSATESEFKNFNEKFYWRLMLNLKAKLHYKNLEFQQVDDCFSQAIKLGELASIEDLSQVRLMSDYAEYKYINNDINKAKELFEGARQLVEKLTVGFNTEFCDDHNADKSHLVIQDLTEDKQKVKTLMNDNVFTLAKGDKTQQKETESKEQGTYSLTKVSNLVDKSLFQFTTINKLTGVENQDLDHNSTQLCLFIYNEAAEVYLVLLLRLIRIRLEPLRSTIWFDKTIEADKLLKELQEIENLCSVSYYIYKKNYFILHKLKAEGEFSKAVVIKLKSVLKLRIKEAEVLENNPPSNVKRYLKKQCEIGFIPHKGLKLVPGFSEFLEKTIVPDLRRAAELNEKALKYLKSESPFPSFGFKTEDVLFELAETNVILALYRPKTIFEYLPISFMKLVNQEYNGVTRENDV